jgi:hypothetical protein
MYMIVGFPAEPQLRCDSVEDWDDDTGVSCRMENLNFNFLQEQTSLAAWQFCHRTSSQEADVKGCEGGAEHLALAMGQRGQ